MTNKLIKKLNALSNENMCIYCAIEEMSELTKVLTKKLRQNKDYNLIAFEIESAHALAMISVLIDRFGASKERIFAEEIKCLEKAISYYYREE